MPRICTPSSRTSRLDSAAQPAYPIYVLSSVQVKTPTNHWSARVRPIIPCLVTVCPGNKEGFCLKPEAIQIDKRGVCKVGARFIR